MLHLNNETIAALVFLSVVGAVLIYGVLINSKHLGERRKLCFALSAVCAILLYFGFATGFLADNSELKLELKVTNIMKDDAGNIYCSLFHEYGVDQWRPLDKDYISEGKRPLTLEATVRYTRFPILHLFANRYTPATIIKVHRVMKSYKPN